MVLEHKQIQSLDDFFTTLGKRREKGVYFYRINGMSEDVRIFLNKYYEAARRSGVIIEGKIENPTENNLSYYSEMMGMDYSLNPAFISTGLKKWLPRMNDHQRETVALAMYDTLAELARQGKTENMQKNAYIKFMCWLYYKFERIVNQLGAEEVPKILYVGEISKYELMLMTIISNAGCDIVLVQKDKDKSYLQLDSASTHSYDYKSANLEDVPADFSVKQMIADVQKKAEEKRIYGSAADIRNCTNAWITGKPLEDIAKAPILRGDDPKLFYNVFCRMNGAQDRLTYANELYQFQMALKNQSRKVVIVNEQIPKPTPEEINDIKRTNYTNIDQLIMNLQANIQTPASSDLRGILVKAFVEIINSESKLDGMNINKLTNKAVYLLCWLKRYQTKLYGNWKRPDIGCFIYMGGCRDASESMFMSFLARTPADVFILCPNLNEHCLLQDKLLYEVNNQASVTIKRFPEQNANLHIATAAYHAERDLDELMYNDSILFRNQQFSKANSISLQTMDREIKILWDNDLKYRPNFSTVDGVVNIPVIFSKMSGVKDKDTEKYWIAIKQLITENTVLIDKVPFINQSTPNPIKMYATEFFKNGKLARNRIKSHKAYQYGFLREEMQEHILDKLEALIEQRLIKGTFENGTEYTIISVALNMPKNVTRLLQQFDFTKKNPKLIYVSTGENLPTLEDSIHIAFLNMLGFDIIFFVPTGYNMENYYTRKLMEEHQIGEYMYDLQIPDWNTVPDNAQKSWVDKIFKRG